MVFVQNMFPNAQYVNDDRGQDEVCANMRSRAYVPDNPVATYYSPLGTLWMQGTGVPTSFASGSQTYTAAILGGGIIVHKNAGLVNGTLDTATNIINYMNNNSAGVQVGDILQCLVCNSGTSTLTIVADASGTIDGNVNAAIPPGTSRMLNIRLTLATPALTLANPGGPNPTNYFVYC